MQKSAENAGKTIFDPEPLKSTNNDNNVKIVVGILVPNIAKT